MSEGDGSNGGNQLQEAHGQPDAPRGLTRGLRHAWTPAACIVPSGLTSDSRGARPACRAEEGEAGSNGTRPGNSAEAHAQTGPRMASRLDRKAVRGLQDRSDLWGCWEG